MQVPPGREESEPGSQKKKKKKVDEPAGSRAEEMRLTWHLEMRRNVAILFLSNGRCFQTKSK